MPAFPSWLDCTINTSGYDFRKGQVDESPRESFLYVNDDQQLTGLRYDNWKLVFMEQRAPGTLLVPTLTFERLFAFLVLGHGRRELLWYEVTRHPTAAWLARQITEAFPWTSALAYLVRDNDRAFGHLLTSRVRAMGIRDRPISPGSPWQNGCVERLIGTLCRECLDQMLIFGEAQLRRVLSAYAAYYNQARTHLALQKDAPLKRSIQRVGRIAAIPVLAGLHHQYVRI